MSQISINYTVFDSFPTVETERLLLRKLDISDCKMLFELRSNPQVMKYLDAAKPQNEAVLELFCENIAKSWAEKNGIYWIIEHKAEAKAVGNFSFWRIDHPHCRAEIGYAMLPEYWGQGIMSEVLDTLLPFGFSKMQLHSVEANVNPDNQLSNRLLLKHGFQKEAYFRENYLFDGKFLDSEIYCLLEKDFTPAARKY